MGNELVLMVEMMMLSQGDLECFIGGREKVIGELRDRLFPYRGQRKPMTKRQCEEFVDDLIQESYRNWRTRVYDKF